MKPKIFVVIPAFNEEGRVGKVIREIPRSLVEEVIVVNDNSSDGTAAEATTAGAKVISHNRNLGVGAAIKTGYYEALRRKANITLIIAGDGQHDPSEIPKLVEPILNNDADYIVGDRLSHPSSEMPTLRYLGNRLLTFLTRLFTKLDVKDSQCGYTAITSESLKKINLEFVSDKWGVPNDLLFECANKGLRVKYVPIKTIYGGRKSYISLPRYIFRVSTILFRGYIRHLYFYHSLYVFSLSGAVLLLIGFVYGLYTVYETLKLGYRPPGIGSVILDATLILAGVQLLVFGFLMDAIKMIERRVSEFEK